MINDKLQDDIKNRKLEKSSYTFGLQEHHDLKLEDHVILYHNGDGWKIVPLIVLLSYPVIYDEYVYEDKKEDLTIVLCPVTLRGGVFKGIFEVSHYDDYRMILKGDNDLLPIDLNLKINKKFLIQENKRLEFKLMTLRNAIIYAPDAKYMKCKDKLKPVINTEYYDNHKNINDEDLKQGIFHPKSVVYIVHYESLQMNDTKQILLIGNDIKQKTVTGYDLSKSKLNDHLLKNGNKIYDKNGYVMSVLWYIAMDIYKDVKIHYIK